jgi:hypothetical protein
MEGATFNMLIVAAIHKNYFLPKPNIIIIILSKCNIKMFVAFNLIGFQRISKGLKKNFDLK